MSANKTNIKITIPFQIIGQIAINIQIRLWLEFYGICSIFWVYKCLYWSKVLPHCVTYIERWRAILYATVWTSRAFIFTFGHCIVFYSTFCTLVISIPLNVRHDFFQYVLCLWSIWIYRLKIELAWSMYIVCTYVYLLTCAHNATEPSFHLYKSI